MAKIKYGHLIKRLNYQKGPAGNMVWPTGRDLEGLNLNFVWGYVNTSGDLSTTRHIHPYGECYIFAGLDYAHPNDIGADIEVAMGDEGEKYTFNKTTVIITPAGFAHGPVLTRRIDRPYGYLIISLDGENKVTESPNRSGTPPVGNKYTHLMKKLEMRDTNRKKGGNADFIAGWNGKEMKGFELNFTWALHTGLGAWHEHDPHVHPSDEALLFVGLDPDNPDYLGAEIEIAMGEEQEKHIFNTPTVVVAPGGFVHCPLITRKVEKPYGFSAISLSNGHDTKWLG